MTIFERAVLRIRHTPMRSILVFFLYVAFSLILVFLFSMLTQLNFSLDTINETLNLKQSDLTINTEFFQSLAETIKHKQDIVGQLLLFTIVFGAIGFTALHGLLLFFRRKELLNFRLIGEKKRKIFFQLVLENLILLNVFLLFLFVTSVFFRQPVAQQLNQIEQNFVGKTEKHFLIQTNSTIISATQDDKLPSENPQPYKEGVSKFNTVTLTDANQTIGTNPQRFVQFALGMNLFTLLCMSPAALWFLNRNPLKYG